MLPDERGEGGLPLSAAAQPGFAPTLGARASRSFALSQSSLATDATLESASAKVMNASLRQCSGMSPEHLDAARNTQGFSA